MQGNVLGQTGSNLKINGIIEEYKVASSGKVNAGDFVKYINTYGIDIGENTQISSADYSGNIGSAVQIDTNKVFIAYSSGSLVTLYGIICIIEEENITAGEATQLSTIAYSGNLPVVLQIDTNKVF